MSYKESDMFADILFKVEKGEHFQVCLKNGLWISGELIRYRRVDNLLSMQTPLFVFSIDATEVCAIKIIKRGG